MLKFVPSGTPIEDSLVTMDRLGFACQVRHVQEMLKDGFKAVHDSTWDRAVANGESFVSCDAAKPWSFWRDGLVSLTQEHWNVTLFYKAGLVTDVEVSTYWLGP